MNRDIYVPMMQVTDRLGTYVMPDWLSATYVGQLQNLVVQEQYILQPQDVPFPDLISYRYYKTTDYWWLLCMFNGTIDPIWDMNPGQTWQIPTYKSIQSVLSKSALNLNTGNNAAGAIVII